MNLLAGILVCAAGLALAAAGRRHPLLRSGGLALALGGFFAAFTAGLMSPAAPSPGRSAALLAGAIAVFRLMAGFEKARDGVR